MNEPGCLAYRFYSETGDEHSFLLMADWQSEAALVKHLQSNNFAVPSRSPYVVKLATKHRWWSYKKT
jgi:quinol monooxygenase YgiN